MSIHDIKRCSWVNNDPLYISYHDEEWGVPVFDSLKLFELLCLEGQQAGLSWITILKKRENYRKLFHNFNPNDIVTMGEIDVQNLLCESGIVRHKGKINAIINNAKCFLDMERNNEIFSDLVWNIVNHEPVVNNWISSKDVPSETNMSRKLSKDLKLRGFKYVGSTICYAFLQASGVVNDHVIDCICRSKTKDVL